MSLRRTAATTAASRFLPGLAAGYVRSVLEKAIDGIGPLRSAAAAADSRLVDAGGDVEKAISALTRSHVAIAGAQGFVTNLGGLITAPVSMPANIAGVTIVQCHLVAGIAHLRGYDLDDPRVRNAVLACMLGKSTIGELVQSGKLPTRPMAMATAPAHDPALDEKIASHVTSDIVGQATGKRAVAIIARRMPILGGMVGGSTDALDTYQAATYASQELKDRRI
jgi:uncharacterized protein (DUF697 family)